MKRTRELRLLALGLVLGPCFLLATLAGWLTREGRGDDRGSPDTFSDRAGMHPPNIEALIRQARSRDEATRERAVGRLLPLLKPGMSREQVEAWLGPPSLVHDGGWVGEEDTIICTYYRRDPTDKGAEVMNVDYKKVGKSFRFVKVHGPLFPWE
jgi:hypothetical protein